jgi:hypothetical protein
MVQARLHAVRLLSNAKMQCLRPLRELLRGAFLIFLINSVRSGLFPLSGIHASIIIPQAFEHAVLIEHERLRRLE